MGQRIWKTWPWRQTYHKGSRNRAVLPNELRLIRRPERPPPIKDPHRKIFCEWNQRVRWVRGTTVCARRRMLGAWAEAKGADRSRGMGGNARLRIRQRMGVARKRRVF